jgi:hypothetical protein
VNEEHCQMCEDCEARESKLNHWERDFIAKISDQLADGLVLTALQADMLKAIHLIRIEAAS